MSAKIFAKPAEWVELKTRPATQKIWEASEFGTKASVSTQEPPVQVRVRDGQAELSVNMQGGSGAQLLDDREMLIECGEALFHLKLVLQRFGRLGQVQLFPDLDHLSLVARIPCEFSDSAKAVELLAFEDLFRDRREFIPVSEVIVSNQILARLATVGTGRAWLDFSQSGLSRKQLCDIETSNYSDSSTGRHYNDEPAPQVPTGPSLKEAITGALSFFGVSRIGSLLLGPPTRSPPLDSTSRTSDGVKTIGEMGSLAVLKTKTDDRYGWLAAGEVTARVQLEAQTLGVSSQVFGRAFREKRPRQELRNIIGRKGFVQAIIGFGSQSPTSFTEFDSPPSLQPPVPAPPSQIQMRLS